LQLQKAGTAKTHYVFLLMPTPCFVVQFVVRTRPDKRFIRTGNDLLYNATITLVDALLGFSVKVRIAMTVTADCMYLLFLYQSSAACKVKITQLEATLSIFLFYFADPASGRT